MDVGSRAARKVGGRKTDNAPVKKFTTPVTRRAAAKANDGSHGVR